jgi:hypothetical protein
MSLMNRNASAAKTANAASVPIPYDRMSFAIPRPS